MGDKREPKLWIFSNKSEGTYEGQEWDLNFTFHKHGYYFLEKEPSRTRVAEGDTVYLRVFGDSYIGKCSIAEPWKPDPDGPKKYEVKTGLFPIDELIRWKRPLPQSLIIRDLSTSDVRHRIVPIESADGTTNGNIEQGCKVHGSAASHLPDRHSAVRLLPVEEARRGRCRRGDVAALRRGLLSKISRTSPIG
jgi:hypothetical protein